MSAAQTAAGRIEQDGKPLAVEDKPPGLRIVGRGGKPRSFSKISQPRRKSVHIPANLWENYFI
jgi:hypothetical protein